jgi:hypothetical protein
MTEHEQRADALEREAAEMEKRSDRLEDDIEDTRKDWERKKADPSVPGAAGNPKRAEGDPPPEQEYPTKREP